MPLGHARRLLTAVAVGVAVIGSAAGCRAQRAAARTSTDPPSAGALERRTIRHGGLLRSYHVHRPADGRGASPRPLLFVLHGGNGTDAATMARRTGFNAIAGRDGALVVYPAGVDGQWNDGRGRTFRRAADNSGIDDVGFIGAVTDALVASGEADPARVYVTGFSNGGMMTQRLGIELGDRFAAIASVIANIPVPIAGQPPRRPLPVLVMNGTADPLVPYDGGPVRVLGGSYGEVTSTDRTIAVWTTAAGLGAPSRTDTLPDRDPRDGCRVEVTTWSRSGTAAEVVLVTLRGGGHNIPGVDTPDRPRLVGPKCMEINGPEMTWEFLRRFRR